MSTSKDVAFELHQAHGFLGDPSWPLPVMVTQCDEPNRKDQGNITAAHEFMDTPEVLQAKVKACADLVRKARSCCAYTGAGLSKSSGIPDYATKAENSVVSGPKLASSLDAEPTYAHHCLVSIYKAGMLHHWVQQNHDGLPQKAGFPQDRINEIHGAWFDPSNPVVPFSGNLRSDLFRWMEQQEADTDLCLCLGTSLSGMNADRMARTPAAKAVASHNKSALGTIIVNLQRTPLDDVTTLRVWCKLDEFFKMLMVELGLTVKPKTNVHKRPTGNVFTVPYNEEGNLDLSCRMTLDLNAGALVQITPKTAPNAGCKGTCRGSSNNGWTIAVDKVRCYGWWWISEALEGNIAQLPVINQNPVIKRVKVDPNDPRVRKVEGQYDAEVAQMLDMGFDPEAALKALRATRGDVLAASVYLTEGENAEL